MVCLALASGFAVVQNLVGIGVATSFGLDPMFGVLAGSATLTGGPPTGLAFAPLFEEAGLVGAEPIAIPPAMAGLVSRGLVGGPAIPLLSLRLRLQPGKDHAATGPAAVAPTKSGAWGTVGPG